MELLRINDRKLKVTLSSEDMTAYSLTCEKIDYDNTETRRAFWCILDEAKHKTGFDAASDKVYVQIFPSRGGGCEMYVTKMTDSPEVPLPVTLKKEPLFFEKALFRFEKIEDMLSACACLIECGFTAPSTAYAASDGYYLSVGQEEAPPFHERRRGATAADLVAEFGLRMDASAEGWLTEHAECICPEHAVERYASLSAAGRPRVLHEIPH